MVCIQIFRSFLMGMVATMATLPLSISQSITPKVVLATAFQDVAYQQSSQKLLLAQQLRFHVPLVSKVEARLGLNGTAWRDTIYGNLRNEDFYGITVGFNSLQTIKGQKNVKAAQVEWLKAENHSALESSLYERYALLAQWAGAAHRLKAEKQLLESLDQKKKILGLMLDQGIEVRVKEIIQTEADRTNLSQSIKAHEATIGTQQRILTFWQNPDSEMLSYPLNLDLNQCIDVKTIDSLLEQWSSKPNFDAELNALKAKISEEEAQLWLKNRDNRQIFNQIQLGYQNPIGQTELPKNKRFNNNYSVRFTLAVPLVGNNNFKRSEQILALQKATDSWQTQAYNKQQNYQTQRALLKGKIAERAMLQTKWSESLIPKMLNNTQLKAQLTALEVVELQIEAQKYEVEKAKIEAEIWLEYGDWLQMSGLSAQMPLKNYFSKSLELF